MNDRTVKAIPDHFGRHALVTGGGRDIEKAITRAQLPVGTNVVTGKTRQAPDSAQGEPQPGRGLGGGRWVDPTSGFHYTAGAIPVATATRLFGGKTRVEVD